MGFVKPLVNAQAESSTYPFTETDLPASLPANSRPAKTQTAIITLDAF
jgi:hypothetical protein